MNPNDPKDAEMISKMLEELDEKNEEDMDFKLYLTDDEPLENLLLDYDSSKEGTNSIPFTQKKTEESQEPQAIEKATGRNILRSNKMLTRSQTTKNRDAQQNKLPRVSHNKRMKLKE